MGAPSSGIIAGIFLERRDHTLLTNLTHTHSIIHYFPYVDDILLIFDPIHTDIQAILKDFNALHPNLQFTAEIERDNTLNYLDISIHKTPNSIKTSIHRKSTFTDTIILYRSNHPIQHKYAAVRFLSNRPNSYDLQEKEYQQELNVILNFVYNKPFYNVSNIWKSFGLFYKVGMCR